MATMIPAQIYLNTASPGEKEIFQRFVNDPNTKDWIILHSLDIAEHIKRIQGEADFIIIVPKFGVLCLEVKASLKIQRVEGLWYYGNNKKPDRRGPFKQSSDAMHSIRNNITKKDIRLSSIPFWSAVIFPYVKFNIQSGEWHSWQVIDEIKFNNNEISKLIITVLKNAREFLRNKNVKWLKDAQNEPTLD